jgi:hypothetical protein
VATVARLAKVMSTPGLALLPPAESCQPKPVRPVAVREERQRVAGGMQRDARLREWLPEAVRLKAQLRHALHRQELFCFLRFEAACRIDQHAPRLDQRCVCLQALALQGGDLL